MKTIQFVAAVVMLAFVAGADLSYAQQTWAHVFAGDRIQRGDAIVSTPDGGFAVLTTGNGTGSSILRVDSAGAALWRRSLSSGLLRAIANAVDGGFILVGDTTAFGPFAQGVWVVKLDSTGSVVWQKAYGGVLGSLGQAVQSTSDGGFILGGTVDWDPSLPADAWVAKFDPAGKLIWNYRFGNEYSAEVHSIVETSDHGYVLLIQSYGFTPMINGDFWLVALDSHGRIVWQKAIGGDGDDYAGAVGQFASGDILAVGGTYSFGSSDDAWLVKLGAQGKPNGPGRYQRVLGGGGADELTALHSTSDGGMILVGDTTSFGAGDTDAWAVKLSAGGEIEWQRTYGGAGSDGATGVVETAGGGFAIVGWAYSYLADGLWVLRTDAAGNIAGSCGLVGFPAAVPSDTAGSVLSTRLSREQWKNKSALGSEQTAPTTTIELTICGE